MTTLYDFLRTVASKLNDDEVGAPFQRYTLEEMLAAYNAGLCLAAKYREDLFTEYRVVQLNAGRYQDVRGCCSKVLDVLDQVREDGSTIRKISSRTSTTKVSRNWNKRSCLARGIDGYVVSTVDLDRNMDGRFIVEPPVPCGVEVFVRVKCVERPCPYDESTVNAKINAECELNAAVWHYVLAMMLSGDRFSNPANADKQYHYRMFFDMLGIILKQSERLEEPT